jgi:hypothetical protein
MVDSFKSAISMVCLLLGMHEGASLCGTKTISFAGFSQISYQLEREREEVANDEYSIVSLTCF